MVAVLRSYPWPGNVRELQNALERACALCDDGVIALKDLPERILQKVGLGVARASTILTPAIVGRVADAAHMARDLYPAPLKDFLHQQEIDYIEHTIQAMGGDRSKAAELLGISMATLYRKIGRGPDEETEPS